jgi:hypothetical protein
MLQLPKDSQFDEILAWAQNGGTSKISETQKARYLRWVEAHGLFMQYGDNEKVANTMVTKHGYSISTAYRDLADAKRFFGTQYAMDKKYARVFIWGRTIEALTRAVKNEDSKAEMAGLKMLYLIAGLDKDDMDLPEWKSLLVQNNILIVSDPKAAGLEPISEERMQQLTNKYLNRQKHPELSEGDGRAGE